MIFGCAVNPWKDTVTELEMIKKMGFHFGELQLHDLSAPEMLLTRRREIEKVIKKTGLFLLAHAPWWAEVGSLNEEVRKTWVEESEITIDIVKKLDIRKINFHAHYDNKNRKKSLMKNIKSFNEICDYASKKNIEITLENTVENAQDLMNIIENVEQLNANIDIGHAFMAGGMKNIIDLIKTAGPRIHHLHLHDALPRMDHQPFGKGKINFTKVFAEIGKLNYSSTATLEIFMGEQKDVIYSYKKMREFWNGAKNN